ncbi:MAG: hypothetical protein RLZZ79_572 [Actinomycetota bacterium]|jgi:KDO2-lipid IV(A) lauroyltransferase
MWRIVRWLPERVAYGGFRLASRYIHRRNGKRVKRLRGNYAKARPNATQLELERLVGEGLSNAMRYWCDTFRIADWDERRIATTVSTNREELLLEGVKSGRGLVVALPHSGNWDYAGLYFCSKGITVHTVAEHLKPERLFRRFLTHREAMGMKVLDIKANVLDELNGILSAGGLVALVADRDLSRSGIDVDLLGANARMPAGPALLAYRTGADLITAFVSYTSSGINIDFSGPIAIERNRNERSEVQRVTQLLADQFSQDISKNPSSWQMMQRVFVSKLSEDVR